MDRQGQIINSIINGNWTTAKAQLESKCKTNPERMAWRLARVCCALVDPEGFHKRPDLAERFINMFDKERGNR